MIDYVSRVYVAFCLLGTITVNDGSQLDFERQTVVRLTVQASASGQRAFATVLVSLNDVNDNDPRFSQDRYAATVREGAKIRIFFNW